MKQGGFQKRQEEMNDPVNEFMQKLKNLNNDLSKIEDRDIFHPQGYAKKIVVSLGLEGVQLRRFYFEIRSIYERMQENKNINELLYRLYRLYAITQYQENRGVIKPHFGKLIRAILDSLEKNFNEESLRKASDFFMAMVAYSKKKS